MKSTKVQTLGAVDNMFEVCSNQLQKGSIRRQRVIRFARAHDTCDGKYTEGAHC